jgi:hypothetical protein
MRPQKHEAHRGTQASFSYQIHDALRTDHLNLQRPCTTICFGSGLSNCQWLCCSPFASSAHSSRRNLLTLHRNYHESGMVSTNQRLHTCPAGVGHLVIRRGVQVYTLCNRLHTGGGAWSSNREKSFMPRKAPATVLIALLEYINRCISVWHHWHERIHRQSQR